jgi:hypothetical protein
MCTPWTLKNCPCCLNSSTAVNVYIQHCYRVWLSCLPPEKDITHARPGMLTNCQYLRALPHGICHSPMAICGGIRTQSGLSCTLISTQRSTMNSSRAMMRGSTLVFTRDEPTRPSDYQSYIYYIHILHKFKLTFLALWQRHEGSS